MTIKKGFQGPGNFRREPLFEYVIEGDQITLYPLSTVRKFPARADLTPVSDQFRR